MTAGLAVLLADLAAGIPVLPGALCVGSHELFDPVDRWAERPKDVQSRHRAALRLCRRCPAAEACESWVEGMPRWDRPLGVVAGKVRGVRSVRSSA